MDYRLVATRLRETDHILLITHRRPDGDTIGSAVALCLALRSLGKHSFLLKNEEAHGLFQPYMEGLCATDDFIPSYVVTLDTAALELLPDNARHYEKAIDLCIDHHGSNTGYAKESCVDSTCAACGELVYRIVKELCPLTQEMAKQLYIAISTDTGCFVFSNTTPNTHRIVAELMELGCSHEWVNKRHFRTKSFARLRLEGLLTEEMLLLDEGRTVVSPITLEMVSRIGANEEDLENITSFLEHLKGVENAVTLRELAPGRFKISLRTGKDLNASQVCSLFGGGGHPAAAGCSIDGNLQEVQEAILSAIAKVMSMS